MLLFYFSLIPFKARQFMADLLGTGFYEKPKVE